jgi:hypothetical protein
MRKLIVGFTLFTSFAYAYDGTPNAPLRGYTAAAIRYALSRWRALTRYIDDGQLEIGRVEMWRGGEGLAYLFPALSVAGPHYPDPAPF